MKLMVKKKSLEYTRRKELLNLDEENPVKNPRYSLVGIYSRLSRRIIGYEMFYEGPDWLCDLKIIEKQFVSIEEAELESTLAGIEDKVYVPLRVQERNRKGRFKRKGRNKDTEFIDVPLSECLERGDVLSRIGKLHY